MRLIILGSGSSGNSVYIESGDTSVLVDAGLSGKEAAKRMVDVGVDPGQLNGIIVTHEHGDHARGVRTLSKTTNAPVFITRPTKEVCQWADEDVFWGEEVESSKPFQIGCLDIRPFSIPHDGVDTFAVTVESQGVKVGVVTDLGYISQLVAQHLRGATLVMIESNHDRDMLKVGPYPWSVKQRIASNTGHLSNDEVGRWIKEDFDGDAEYIVLAHLSRHCNHPEIARINALRALDYHGSLFFRSPENRVRVAPSDRVSEWFEL